MFADRKNAGMLLAEKLERYLSTQPAFNVNDGLLVVGIPRGGVPVALEVARKFGCPLEIIVAKKLPFPGQPEYAIGAVSSDGVLVVNPDVPQDPEWIDYIEEQRQRLLIETANIEQQFYHLAGCKRRSFKDKLIVLVDDGIATGMTALAAIETAHLRCCRAAIMAAPVMSAESYRQLSSICDAVIAIDVPEDFQAVGRHYQDFTQTSNEEVIAALRHSNLIHRSLPQTQESDLKSA